MYTVGEGQCGRAEKLQVGADDSAGDDLVG